MNDPSPPPSPGLSGVGDPTNNLRELAGGLRVERDRFVALAFSGADLLFELDGDGSVLFSGGATMALLGSDADALRGAKFIELVEENDRKTVSHMLEQCAAGLRLDQIVVRLHAGRGRTPPLTLSGIHLGDLGGHTYLNMRLAGLGPTVVSLAGAERDEETGMLDKESFSHVASEALRGAETSGEQCQFTLFDVGDFGSFRARLDAEAQQDLLSTVGAFLRASSLAGDTAGRLDESHYGVVHRQDVDVDRLGQQIADFAAKVDPEGEGLSIASSTVELDTSGLSETETAQALVYTINEYCQRASHEFSIRNLSESLNELTDQTVERISRYATLIEDGEFGIAYQPICDLNDGRPHHFEALMRLNDQTLGVTPYQFITFAEEVGLICDFDLAMCGKVITSLKQLNGGGHRYMVAVNLSGRSLSTPAWVDSLHALLNEHTDMRHQLMFEVTESAKIRNLNSVNMVIQSLRRAGHVVCLDDFGAGAAAFKYLGALDVDVVKIDGDYVANALLSVKGKALLKAMAGLCRDLGIATVGEMIEDENHALLVRECGIRLGQGYLYGRPNRDISAFDSPRPTVFDRTNGTEAPRAAAGM